MSYIKFPCGCKFKIANSDDDGRVLSSTLFDKLPRVDISLDPWNPDSIYRVSTTCPAVWDMIGAGKTKGVFQLESQLGRQWAIKTLPRCLEDMGALGALLRPGCVSGDTKITIRHKEWVGKKRKNSFSKISLRELYNSRIKSLVSLDESSNTLIKSKIEHVSYNGDKEVFSPKFKITKRQYETSESFYSLECTDDHKLLVYKRGWVELKDINLGDRVAVINSIKQKRSIGKSNFRDVCFQNYEEKCIFCDWNLGSLDVNHLDGNRNTNNYKDNLCFMCPNHHRMYSEGTISKEEALHYREDCVINNSKHIVWAEYIGKKSLGIKDVYDIGVIGDNHNFIAGNVVVHNCLRAMSGDPPKSMTQRYADRKVGNEPVVYFHQCLVEVLNTTYGVLTYQEQAMRMAEIIAKFNKQEADVLRKAIGKKKADIMAKVEKEFLEKAEAAGVVTLDEAKEIFSWIRESQKYSFNKCLSPNTIVETTNGYKTIEEVKIGDKVLSPSKNGDVFVDVIDKHDNGEQELYEITTESGKIIQCTLNHKLLCEDGKLYPVWEILEKNLKIVCQDD